mgnify:FL=1
MIAAHFNLGTAYMLTKSYNKAELSFKDCLKLRPNHEPALYNLARVYQNKKQWINSNEVFKKFIKIKGPNPSVYSQIAWNNLLSGNMGQANTFYAKVLSYEPNHIAALINLGKLNYRLGKYEISQSYIKRALKQDLSQTQLDDLNKLLTNISTD